MAALLYAAKAEDCPFEIVLVASNNSEADGLKLARAEGIATFARSHKGMKRSAFDTLIDTEVRKARADYIALAGYMRLLSSEFVAQWEGRMLNIHPSLLPKYKGLRTHEQALLARDSYSGCSVHIVTAQLDDGPVLGQTKVAILSDDTPDSLAARILIAEHQLYPRVLAEYVVREADPDWIIAKVGKLAMALPKVHYRRSHGSPGWRVGAEQSGKFFAYVSVRHHGEDAIALLVKTSGPDELTALIEQAPEIYYKPAYYGASGWIALRLDRPGTDWDHVESWLKRSWSRVAPKRLTTLIDTADSF